MSKLSRFFVTHFGLSLAAIACVIGYLLYRAEMFALAMMFLSVALIWIGDAWDEETRP